MANEAGTHLDRVDLEKTAPGFYRAMLALDRVSGEGLEIRLVNLVKVRTSQINGCVYCMNSHSEDARAAGETEQRLYVLPGWAEASLYTERECAALALTEAITLVADSHVPDAVYVRATEFFNETELAALTAVIITMNAWNRIGVTSRLQPAE